MNKVIVVGAGAAGMMAAYFAAKNKNKVTLIEKNEKTGKKMKSLERNFISREKADAILQMHVM